MTARHVLKVTGGTGGRAGTEFGFSFPQGGSAGGGGSCSAITSANMAAIFIAGGGRSRADRLEC